MHEDRCIGALLGCACGDILGANVEFRSRQEIIMEQGRLRDFMSGPRHPLGVFTDDTEMTLAVAVNLNHRGGIWAKSCADSYATFYGSHPRRAYGPSTTKIMEALLYGADYLKTGKSVIPDGSFANGGAMRIAPIGLAYRNASRETLYKAVRLALLPTHVHPEGIDGAFIQALAVAQLCKWDLREGFITKENLLYVLLEAVRTERMRKRLLSVGQALKEHWHDSKFLSETCEPNEYGDTFQIHAADAVASCLWAFLNNVNRPEQAIIHAVSLGGDTDTIGAMTGALAGSLHGASFLPSRWLEAMENEPGIGRDFIIDTAKRLAQLNCDAIP